MESKTLGRIAHVVALIATLSARVGAQSDSTMPFRVLSTGGRAAAGDGLLLEEPVAGRYYVPQDQHSLMTPAGPLQVSTQTGYYQVVETDLELPGKNGFDLRISRRYDVDAARREKEKAVSDLAAGEKAYSVGTGWRLDLPFVQVLPNAPPWGGPDWEREKFVQITLPSGARYSLRDMSWISAETNLRVYLNTREVTFRVLCYTDTNTYKLVMADGTVYSMNANGVVTAIDGRAPDGHRGGTVSIAYDGSNLVSTITDTRARVLTFDYATVGGLPQITQITLTNDPDALRRHIHYGYESGTRKLSQAVLVAGPTGHEVSHAWTHQYEDASLTRGSANPVTVQVPLVTDVVDWRGGRATISQWEVRQFQGRGDARDEVLVREVEVRDRVLDEEATLYERLAARTRFDYTRLDHSATGETYIPQSVETRTDVTTGAERQIRYEFWAFTETGWDLQPFVLTKPRSVRTTDPSGLTDYLEMTEYVYYTNIWKVAFEDTFWSGGTYSCCRNRMWTYDDLGNAKDIWTWSNVADRQTGHGQFTRFWGADFYPHPDVPWRSDYPYTPAYPDDYLQPMNLPMWSVLSVYYPFWDGSQIIDHDDSQVQHLHSAHNYDSLGQRTAAARYDGSQWLATTYAYTAAGRPQQTVQPGGLQTTYVYNEAYATDLELVTATNYDPNNVIDAEVSSHQIVTRTATEASSGWIRWTMSGRGYVSEFSLDPFGRRIGIVLPDVNESDDTAFLAPEDQGFAATRVNNPRVGIQYNDTDLWVETTDPEDRVSRTHYASFLKPERAIRYNPGGSQYTEVVTDWDYDGWRRLIARKDPPTGTDGSYAGQRTTTYEYDILGNVTRQVHPDGERLLWEREYSTGLVTFVNERGYVTEIQLDFDDRILAVTQHDGAASRTRSRHYDGVGNVRIDEDAKGNVVQRTYTDLGQLKRIEFPNDPQWPFVENGAELVTYPQPYVEYQYNPDGVRIKNSTTLAGNVLHTIECVVDGLGRGIELRLPYTDDGGAKTAITLVAFDADGNRIDVVDANNSPLPPLDRKHLRYQYSPARTTLSRIDPEGGRADFTYHLDGRIETITDPRGTSGNYPSFPGDFTRTYQFDSLARLSFVDYPLDADGVTQPRVSYTYYPSGTVAAVTAPDGGLTALEYTPRSQVKRREVSGDGRTYQTLYYYDERGNSIQTVHPGGAVSASVFDAWDRLVGVGASRRQQRAVGVR